MYSIKTSEKMQRIIAVYIILFFSILKIGAQSPDERYEQAGELYSSGDYPGSAAIYRQLYEEGYRSGDLLYNAGNAFYRSGDNATAILFYERAKLLSPADEDIDYNLQIARSRITDRFETVPRLFFARWFDFLALLASTNVWAVTALVLFIASLISAVFFLTRARARGRLIPFWIAVISLVFSALLALLSIRNNSIVNNNRNAIITCSIVTGRSAPGENASELFVIHSGTKVGVEQELGDYSEVMLPDGNRGWVSGDCLEKI